MTAVYRMHHVSTNDPVTVEIRQDGGTALRITLHEGYGRRLIKLLL